jgi:hypothetical protein
METEQVLERLLAKIRANNEKVEILRGAFISQMGAHHAKIEANHEEWMVAMKTSQERWGL